MIPDLPAFLKRGSKEHRALKRRTEKLVREGKAVSLKERADEDAALHALAASFGFKRHQYRLDWLRDPAWVAAQTERKKEREAAEAERAARREANRAAAKEERALTGAGQRRRRKSRGPAIKDDLPKGFIVWIGPNSKKEGTDAHARWEKLRLSHGRSTESFVLDGGNATTLANAIKQGKAKVVNADETKRETGGSAQAERQPEAEPKAAVKRARRARASASTKSRGKALKPRKKG